MTWPSCKITFSGAARHAQHPHLCIFRQKAVYRNGHLGPISEPVCACCRDKSNWQFRSRSKRVTMLSDRMTSACHLIAMGDCLKTNSVQTFGPKRLDHSAWQKGEIASGLVSSFTEGSSPMSSAHTRTIPLRLFPRASCTDRSATVCPRQY